VTYTKSDHALIAIKAALNAVPVVGGSIASLIGDYIPLSTQRSIDRATELLARRLCDLEGRIDPDAVNKDQFSELFKSCYLAVVRTTQEAKLRAASAILANLLLKPGDREKLSYSELDHLIRCTDALSVGALAALGAANRIASAPGMAPDVNGSYSLTVQQVHDALPEFDASLLMGLIGDLNTYNLLRISGVPPIRMTQYGNFQLELTSLGRRFVERFIDA